MKTRTMAQLSLEGIGNLWKNRMMSFASTGIVIATMFMFGIFIVLSMNTSKFTAGLQDKVQIRTFLARNLDKNATSALKSQIEAVKGVKNVSFISKTEAIRIAEKDWKVDESLFKDLKKDTPLKSSFVITLDNAKYADKVADGLKKYKGIDKIIYSSAIVKTLIKVTNIINVVSVVIISILAIISVFIISNTIKLTVMSRRREISIMRVIGATDRFIRWPFVIEGIGIGLIGAVLSFFLIEFSYKYFYVLITNNNAFIKLLNFDSIALVMISTLIFSGIIIGGIGSYISVKKYLTI